MILRTPLIEIHFLLYTLMVIKSVDVDKYRLRIQVNNEELICLEVSYFSSIDE